MKFFYLVSKRKSSFIKKLRFTFLWVIRNIENYIFYKISLIDYISAHKILHIDPRQGAEMQRFHSSERQTTKQIEKFTMFMRERERQTDRQTDRQKNRHTDYYHS